MSWRTTLKILKLRVGVASSNMDPEDESPDHGYSPDDINFSITDGHHYQDNSFNLNGQ